MFLRYDFRSIPDYHQTVIEKATPNVEFTIWLRGEDNPRMAKTVKEQRHELIETRRKNTRALIDRHYDGNRSRFARAYAQVAGTSTKPAYIIDLIREGSTKSFSEKAVFNIEATAGLQRGQLDIPDSPLLLDEAHRRRSPSDELRSKIEDLTDEQMRALIASIDEIKRRYPGRARKSTAKPRKPSDDQHPE